MKDIQAIIFDFDGTLCDSQQLIVRTLQMTLAELGYPMRDDAACAATIGLPLEGCFKELVPGLSDEAADVCCVTYRRSFEKTREETFPSLFPHVMETLNALHAQGIRLAVASSRAHKSVELFCERYDMMPLLDYVVGSNDVKSPKPAPDAVIYILEKMGIASQNALVVGDMTYDILMGARAGVYTCGVTYGNGTREELLACHADHVIDDFANILELIRHS